MSIYLGSVLDTLPVPDDKSTKIKKAQYEDLHAKRLKIVVFERAQQEKKKEAIS